MYFCDEGIALRQRPLRDNDRIVTVFTRKHGKLEVNFKGVRRARARLRALSESVTYSDYRFYLKKTSNFPVCTGGKVISVFNGIRLSREKLFSAFYFNELLMSLTPAAQPAEKKFELLLSALRRAEEVPRVPRALLVAYALILIEYCGIGFKHTNIGVDSGIWEALHDPSFSKVEELEKLAGSQALDSAADLAVKKIREHASREINTLKFVKIYKAEIGE